ncbi:unnamed protein product [Paramecium octaurelia]|uniref:Sperm-tail PG-rich repeat protein n=1 Tax=Paramecium octaurelia TaxID=43137 RepID=A0A8S1UPL3_PAROT|nr:unnamed protein product [Paramecium octaurelia]
MFSFGYKNLYDPKPIIPGPGDYELRKDLSGKAIQNKEKFMHRSISSKKLQNDDSFIHRLKNHNDCYEEYQLNEQRKLTELPKQQNQHSFTTSERSKCFILPSISKGPQYYDVKDLKSDRSLKIGKYSSRKDIFDIQKGGISKNSCSKFDTSISIEQKMQKPQNHWSQDKPHQKYIVSYYSRAKPIPKFRDYSYVSKDKIGPSLIDYPKDKIKGRTFKKDQRFKIAKINKVDIHQEYFIQKLIKNKDQVSSGENDSSASEEFINLKILDFTEKVFFDKQIRVKKPFQDAMRQKVPGPGNYEIKVQSGKQYSFPKGKRYNKFFWDLL